MPECLHLLGFLRVLPLWAATRERHHPVGCGTALQCSSATKRGGSEESWAGLRVLAGDPRHHKPFPQVG